MTAMSPTMPAIPPMTPDLRKQAPAPVRCPLS